MGIRIGSNIASLSGQRRLAEATSALSTTYQRLSSGQRINKGSDDAAGLAIATSLNVSAKTFSQAIRNVNDGISQINIAEGAINAMRDISLRQLELASQAANGSYSLTQRQAMNAEANQLVEEYNRIVQSTEFNGQRLFGDDPQGVRIQAGIGTEGSLLMALGEELSRNVGSGTFNAIATVATGSRPKTVSLADLNGDGQLDMAIAYNVGTDVNIFLGNGDGTFQTPAVIPTGGVSHVVSLADLNADGRQDMVTFDPGANQLALFLGNGDGTFQTRTYLTGGGSTPVSIAIADLNGDERLDIAMVDLVNPRASVFLANGDGTFRLTSTATSAVSTCIKVGDINGDGRADLVTSDWNTNQVNILLGAGDGTFQSRAYLSVYLPMNVSLGDLNGDGRPDLVAADGSQLLSVFIGNGDGTFRAATMLNEAFSRSVQIADLDGDGRMDLVSASYSPLRPAAMVFLGNGDGTFKTSLTTERGSYGSSLVVGDLDMDGRQDLVITDGKVGSSVNVFLGKGSRVSSTPYLNLCTRAGALEAMGVVNDNLQRISNELSTIGASTSRFSVAINTLRATAENSIAAASRITDADVAAESAALVRQQILQQAASAVLAQSNQAPAIAIQLLR